MDRNRSSLRGSTRPTIACMYAGTSSALRLSALRGKSLRGIAPPRVSATDAENALQEGWEVADKSNSRIEHTDPPLDPSEHSS